MAPSTSTSTHQLTLATGHVTPVEQLMVVREAKRLGVQRIVVTHEGSIPGPMTMAQLKEAAALGAFIEVVSGNGAGAQAKAKADRIRELGPERVIVSSDLGPPGHAARPASVAPGQPLALSAAHRTPFAPAATARDPAAGSRGTSC